MVTKILKWIPSVLLALFSVVGGVSVVFFLLASFLMLPIPKLQEFKREKLKIGKSLTVALVIILFLIGAMLSPDSESSNKSGKFQESSTTTTAPEQSATVAQSDIDATTTSLPQTTVPATTSVVTTTPEQVTTTKATEKKTTTTTKKVTTTTKKVTTTAKPKPVTTTTKKAENVVPQKSSFSVKFIDVGQADSALIECDGHYMLIDGGNKADSSTIYAVLKKEGVKKLDIVVGTHAHEDHIGGLPGAFNYTTADLTLCPVTSYDSEAFKDFKAAADKSGSGITVPKVNDVYNLGSAKITILGVNGGSDTNNTSIVLKITYGKTSFLFTGDSEREAEQAILDRGADISATVLKVAHHGSETSTSYLWLREVMPDYAIISVGKGNSYGHPTDDVLSRLKDADVKTYRTDLNGDITAVSDGNKVTITTSKNASDDKIYSSGTTTVTTTKVTTTVTTTKATANSGSSETRYILNTNTHKFHYPSCSSASRISESNRKEYTGTRDELIAQGYSPCGRCEP